MQSLDLKELEKALALSIRNAEEQLASKYLGDDARQQGYLSSQELAAYRAAREDFQTFFRSWIRSFWGITLGEKRILSHRPPGGPTNSQEYWSIIDIKSDEQLVMFKLTYA